MRCLVGDIGGTNSRLAMADISGRHVELQHIRRYRNADHADFTAIARDYLQTSPCDSVCLAVAGPTDGKHVRFTNLDWEIHAEALSRALHIPEVRLINDFSAVGWSLDTLAPDDITLLQAGQIIPQATRAAIGAGTGLGVSLCVWNGAQHVPLASEGGHVGFAPANAQQDRLLAYLREKYGRVSTERLLSGPGLLDLYHFICRERGASADLPHAEAVSTAGLGNSSDCATETLHLFATLYGQIAGDLALTTLARGGLYIAGGIAAKIAPVFSLPGFLNGLHAKGRYREWMQTVPVTLIRSDDIGLKGAAVAASMRVTDTQ